jgi:hypothetical protein
MDNPEEADTGCVNRQGKWDTIGKIVGSHLLSSFNQVNGKGALPRRR